MSASRSWVSVGFMPGVGLVEQEHLRLGADRAGDLEPPLVAVGEVARRAIGLPGEPEELEQRERLLVQLALATPEPRARDDGPEQRAGHVPLDGDLDVVEHRQVAEQPDVLERPGDAEAGDLVARPSR